MTTEKIEAFWENATADDVAGIANTRKPITARFRDSGIDDWYEHSLAGWRLRRSGAGWADSDGTTWDHCQVYREPSWYANKPDPGPGYRLLGKFPDEELKPGDECFCSDGFWDQSFSATVGERQSYGIWYRRRIEPVEPEPIKLEEGSKCPMRGCSGALGFRPVKDCSCHIRPPCSHCADNPPCCPVCEWASGDPIEPVEPEPQHYVLRVGDSVETPGGYRMHVVDRITEQTHRVLRVGDTISTPSGQTITITEKGFEVTQ
jgi:hypothetical protein